MLLVLFAIVFAMPVRAQINLEKTYGGINIFSTDLKYTLVDSGEMKIIYYDDFIDTVFIHNLDHSLDHTIVLTLDQSRGLSNLICITKHLFDTDDDYEFVCTYGNASGPANDITVWNENGTVLFKRDSFTLRSHYTGADATRIKDGIFNTPLGTKMILVHPTEPKYEVYSLPGKLPTSNTKLSATDAPTIISSSSPSTSAYPNPSNGKIRVAYSLPEGVTTGELVITSTDGREVKRYRVGNMFNDILIEKSELASGAYFYKLITERGESEARKFVITQ